MARVGDTARTSLKSILEALLMASDEPLNMNILSSVFAEDERPSNAEIGSALTELAEENIFPNHIIYSETSPFQRIVLTQGQTGFQNPLRGVSREMGHVVKPVFIVGVGGVGVFPHHLAEARHLAAHDAADRLGSHVPVGEPGAASRQYQTASLRRKRAHRLLDALENDRVILLPRERDESDPLWKIRDEAGIVDLGVPGQHLDLPIFSIWWSSGSPVSATTHFPSTSFASCGW